MRRIGSRDLMPSRGACGRQALEGSFVRDHPRRPPTSDGQPQARYLPAPCGHIGEPFLFQALREGGWGIARCAPDQLAGQRIDPPEVVTVHAVTPRPKLANTSLARASPLAVRR